MSNDHQYPHPPTTTGELHRQPPPSTDGTTTKSLPHTHTHTPSPSTPGSLLAAAFGRAIFNIPQTSFQEAAATTTTTTTTPPNIPTNNPLRRTLSDPITIDYKATQEPKKITPLRRSLSDTSEFQLPKKAPRVSSSPQSSSRKHSPQSEIEHRCWEIMREEEGVEEEDAKTNGQEECVAVERLKNGDLKFELGCSCGKKFEMLIEHNGYCFYRLT
ncbi:hypothetical protein HanXRQr2_Chr17g0788031 [Helianthus annuus]|uniref:Uncharacterized protein n=1 Tax=Helianthus annuus TaxID=4232 RepID=A0A9K3GTE8_HELAN|nr:hypothetical protein HanXRQr2_Chr17g0788031 [Helianthus annuus]KAJ0432101.1 hypothetical protein HanIR_Chr17g0855591 [Helianthus annuus]KAJ0631347.1 hypothetical protein HanLR1_Chr17g0653001 [Helianthus annuus]KAJ0635240.1 hypothetical protein HanOQP8_Chr17g0648681 [Helianthus annuus]